MNFTEDMSALRANIDHHQYDLAQLSLRLIDYVVHNQASLEGAVSLESLMDHLTQSARKMNPDDPDRPLRQGRLDCLLMACSTTAARTPSTGSTPTPVTDEFTTISSGSGCCG